MTDNKSFWDKWAKRYDMAMSVDHKTYTKLIRRMMHTLTRDMTVLELACGTGIFSVQLAGRVKLLEATDFSENMIRQAKAKPHSSRLHFSVQDATNLLYANDTFDAVIIANALHIMPNPERALSEISRVLKSDGILIAPTFTAAGSIFGRLKMRMMEVSGFHAFYQWTTEGYLNFLEDNGFVIENSEIYGGSLKLTYAEAKVRRNLYAENYTEH